MELPRIFGHVELTIEIVGKGARARVKPLAVTRLIESRAQGLDPERVVKLVSRICGVCSIAHQVAAVEAFEKAFGFEPSESIDSLRKALLKIHAIQNAAVFLALVAFEELSRCVSNPHFARKALLEINKSCCRALDILVGSAIHPPRIRIGGFPGLSERAIDVAIREMARVERLCLDLSEELSMPREQLKVRGTPVRVPDFSSRRAIELLVQGSWRSVELREEVIDLVLSLEPPPYTGARARILGKALSETILSSPESSIAARLAELPMLAREAIKLLELAKGTTYESVEVKDGIGVAAVEAPRGALIHAYEVKGGIVRRCKIATPTQISLRYIEASAEALAKHLASRGASPSEVEREVASLVRSFDPCIPCAVKVVVVADP